MLETYLTIKTVILLFGLAFLLVYLVLYGIALFQAAAEHHEMWHMKQAEDFRQAGWIINRKNRGEYLVALCEKCKERIDKLGITSDNVRELSQYAADMYLGERFDEVEAEFMSLRRRK